MSFRMATVAPEKQIHPLPATAFFGVVKGDDMATKMTYGEQLKHPNWQRKRLERLNLADFTCECCHNTEGTLHVHHKHYVKGRMAWEYTNEELAVLCESCHEVAHEEDAAVSAMLALLPIDGPFSRFDVGSLVAGWASRALPEEVSEKFMVGQYTFALGLVALSLDRAGVGIHDVIALSSAICDADFKAELLALIHEYEGKNA